MDINTLRAATPGPKPVRAAAQALVDYQAGRGGAADLAPALNELLAEYANHRAATAAALRGLLFGCIPTQRALSPNQAATNQAIHTAAARLGLAL